MKPKNLEKVKPLREKNTTEMTKLKDTPFGKRTRKNKFGQHSGGKEMKNLIKWKNLSRGHNTPVKWIRKRKKHDLDKTR